MTNIAKVDRLAEIKTIVKGLDDEAKLIQKELIEEGAGDKLITAYGTLSLVTRENYECIDKNQAYQIMGKAEYIAASSLPFGAVKKAAGEVRTEMFLANKIFRLKSTSKYYTLRK